MVRCHVAQSWAAMWHPFIWFLVCKILLESVGFDPRTSPRHIAFKNSDRPIDHTLFLILYVSSIVFQFELCDRWQGVGPGLSPGPRSFDCYVTVYISRGVLKFANIEPVVLWYIPCDPLLCVRAVYIWFENS
jgi:hypothetical protein